MAFFEAPEKEINHLWPKNISDFEAYGFLSLFFFK